MSQQNNSNKKKASNKDESISKQNIKIASPLIPAIKPEKLSSSAVNEAKKIISSIEDGNTNQPADVIKCLDDLFKKWKYTKNDVESEILFSLCSEEIKDELLIAIRSKLYQMVDKIFSMKIRREVVLDIPAIETVLMNAHDLGIFNKYQIEKLKISYIKFCRKMKAPDNETLITQLESKSKYQGARGMTKLRELSDETSSDHGKIETKTGHDDGDKELCVVCMDRIREIVYLPCSHFITCPLCGPCLKDCPLCTKKIDKQLKIFWC